MRGIGWTDPARMKRQTPRRPLKVIFRQTGTDAQRKAAREKLEQAVCEALRFMGAFELREEAQHDGQRTVRAAGAIGD